MRKQLCFVLSLALSVMLTAWAHANEIVGIDFGGAATATPTNWNPAFTDALPAPITFGSLIDESGAASPFTLQIDQQINTFATSIVANQIPLHTPSLTDINGNIAGYELLEMSWRNLVPSLTYDIWVLTADTFAFTQEVTIAGSNASVVYNETVAINNLSINGTLGSNALTFDSYAVQQSPDANGVISITITGPNTGFLPVAGLAIRQIGTYVEPPTPDVPEPATLGLLALGGLTLVRRPRRRR